MLKIHHFRNATMVIETEKEVILVDPMLGDKGTMPTFTYFRFKAKKNPIVPLPVQCLDILEKVTSCLITHKHPDHIDDKAISFLKQKNIPVICSIKDKFYFEKKGLDVTQTIDYWVKSDFFDGKIMGVPARHGYGYIAKPMGNVMGYFIELKNQPSIYLSSDTIYTDDVDQLLKKYEPEISVVACGTAQLDLFKPLLMKMDDILKFVHNAPGRVIANHLEAVNHCPTTREDLQKKLLENGLAEKVDIPLDGSTIVY